jgi:hypothetical protein
MSIEKKSLISTLKTTKKANVASAPVSGDAITKTETTRKAIVHAGRRAAVHTGRRALVKS